MFTARSHRFLVPYDGSFRVARAPTKPAKNRSSKSREDKLAEETVRLGDSQHRLYSRGNYSVLVVLQALDAAGKDGTIRPVFGRVTPCGLHVTSFRQPSEVAAAHDLLWRTTPPLPARGQIAIFKRCYYEEVLVVRVHPKFLDAQQLPAGPSRALWTARYRAIVEHERHLARQGTV